MYKLVALDMDGTLLNSQGSISARTKQTIAKARAMGVTVVLASGRPLEGMTKSLHELGMTGNEDYVLCYNGSLVQRVESQTVIRSQLLKGTDAKNIASLSHDFGVHVHAFSRRQGLITPENNHYTHHEAEINGLEITEVDFAELDNGEEILKVMMIDEPERLSAAIARLPASLYEQYTIVQSAPFFLEFMNKNSNKGMGVRALAEHLNIDASAVICMGDAGNDHHMLEYAGLSVAMGNATDETKVLANYITDTNDNDGVAKAIEKFIINA